MKLDDFDDFFEELKSEKTTGPKPEITENGAKILKYMQENYQKYIVDSILKLKNKNYVKKLLNTKCLYFLTNEGERKKLEDFIIK